ncbi:MAG: hypothetical protein IPG99_15115 [Ignavibacteria bacterium]|nr:hypothetical protein [Ignavibacteria bacterium]
MPGEVKDSRVKEIEIKHLIYHVGGWNRNPPDATDEEPGSGMDPTDLDFEIASAYSTELHVTRNLLSEGSMRKYGRTGMES